MLKVVLGVFRVGENYHAVIQVGENPEPKSRGKIVYQKGKEISLKLQTTIEATACELREEAIKWADKEGIPHVENLRTSTYS